MPTNRWVAKQHDHVSQATITDPPPAGRALTSEHSNAPACDHVHQRVVELVESDETLGNSGLAAGRIASVDVRSPQSPLEPKSHRIIVSLNNNGGTS
jgi:hypothetical protein